jgi:DNA-binding MarR family transcriptional regulator
MKDKEINQVREFNRFYTDVIGLLNAHILDSPYSLPEARVLYELYHLQPCSATQLIGSVSMDKGYLSRLLKAFVKSGIVTKKQSATDGRATLLMLTAKGNREFESLKTASMSQISKMLAALSATEIEEVLNHMNELKRILNKSSEL